MEFLVQIEVRLPPSLGGPERDRLVADEFARGRELIAAGHLRHIWRVPGALRNVSIYEAADATELHELISSLPLFPFFTAEVTPLAVHPLRRSSTDPGQ
jgi:muconolactone D-isomerase